ncbi:hypothetical protein [Desulfosarcina cetonica]|uniref:hypothetical protein n=1 Tax=Desulfosarcina cetonica TaxID=90730 RepID=UPI0006CF353E|nr:hypothetical protein [Desulfosarcina cetonica]
MAIGSKRHPESIVAYPWTRRIISTVYYWIIKLLLGLNVRDTQAGFKIYRREVLTAILTRILVKKFAFDLEMLVAAHRLGFTIEEFPIRVVFSRPFGRITFRDCWRTGIDTMAIFYRSRVLDFYGQPAYWEKPTVSVSIIIPFRRRTKPFGDAWRLAFARITNTMKSSFCQTRMHLNWVKLPETTGCR